MAVVWFLVLFAAFNLLGGWIGYRKAGSRASLIAGTVAGIVLLVCAYGMTQHSRAAAIGALLVSAVLGARFAGTWIKARRMMPDLLMVLFSLMTLVVVWRLLLARS